VDAAPRGSIASFQSEIDLHRTLVSLAGCSVLDEAFAHVMRHSLYHAAIRFLPAPQADGSSHARFVAELFQADADEAERLVRRHLGPPMAALEEAARSADADPLPSVRGEPVTLKRRVRTRN
jgi:DNA-binding GntR family transcriptional regulator